VEVVEESERRESRLSAAGEGPSSRKASGVTSPLRKVASPPEPSPLSTPRTPASPLPNGLGAFSTITAYEGGGGNGSKATESNAAGTAVPAVSGKPQETLFGLAPIAPPQSQTGEAAPPQNGTDEAAAARPLHVTATCEVVI
jgi:hypothetical protein